MRSTKPLVRGERTDNGREFCGRKDSHPYELLLAMEVIMGEDRPDRHPKRLVEWEHTVIEQVARRDGHLRRVDLGNASEQKTSTTALT